MPEPSLNAPCPCGSGKKYKRCCLKKPGAFRGGHESGDPESMDERLVEETGIRLVATKDLAVALDWDEFDFGVDFFHPVFDDLAELFQDTRGKPSTEDLIVFASRALVVHGTAEVRARCFDELERRLAGVRQRKTIESGHLALAALADPDIPALQIGLLLQLYYRYMLRRLLERGEWLSEEEKTLDPSLVSLAKEAAVVGTLEVYKELAARLRPLGAKAMPYVEYAASMEDLDESIEPIVRIAEAHPSVRSARILHFMLDSAATDEANEILYAALSKMPSFAWPVLLYRVHDRSQWIWRRIVAAEPLVRAKVWEVYEPLVAELWLPKRDEMEWEDEFYTDIAELLARLGDRRAVGHVLYKMKKSAFPDAAVLALKEAWEENGWWEEVQEGLEALRLGKRILVESGVAFTDLVKEEIAAAPLSAVESAQFRTNLVQDDWNNAYHEDLDWLRPVDLAMMGKRETELMQQFSSVAEQEVRAMRKPLEGKAAADWIGQLQDEWTITPQEQLGGRAPLAVILDEKRHSAPCTGYCEKYLRRKLADLCAGAREALVSSDRERAKRYVGVVLDLDPEHPFGRRLREKLEG